MTIEAELPDGTILEFPDGTDPAIIQRTVKKHMGISAVSSESQNVNPQPEAPPGSIGDAILGGLEVAATIGSSAIAEPISGLAAITSPLNPFSGDGLQGAVDDLDAVRNALTYTPKTESGQKKLKQLSEFFSPVTDASKGVTDTINDSVMDYTGSPTLAGLASSAPLLFLEVLGAGWLGRAGTKIPKGREIDKMVSQAAPDIETLKKTSRGIYDEIGKSGVMIGQDSMSKLYQRIAKRTREAGLDPRVTREASGALSVIRDAADGPNPITELEVLRNVANRVAGMTNDKPQSMLGNIMIDELDNFTYNLKGSDLINKGSDSMASVGKKYRAARKLWGRARRAEVIEDAIRVGTSRAAGPEAGIRNEFNNLLNRKSSKFIPDNEKKIMLDVVNGDFTRNMTRLVGKLGITIDRSPNVFSSAVAGGGLGALAGGVTGAVVVPTIGTASRYIAEGLTKGKAKFTSDIIRAGTDARKIAQAYLQAVPKNKRSVDDLASLLMDPDIDLSELVDASAKIAQDARDIAKGRRAIQQVAGTAAPTMLINKEDEQNAPLQ